MKSKYQIKASKRYRRDVKRLIKSGVDLKPLEDIIDILAAGKTLALKHKDHALKGEYTGVRECHISPDWLLLYVKDNDELFLLLIGTGNHRQALGIE
ncbi:MAG: hypothetical protein JWM56_1125 [Candidatus Peribacteria bacterium]|nr:hypothetical protein [Candidatus Peribacteria bacterium]